MGTLYLLYFLRDKVHYARLFPGQWTGCGVGRPVLVREVVDDLRDERWLPP